MIVKIVECLLVEFRWTNGGTKRERSSMGDVSVTAWHACPLITAGPSRQGHGDLAVPARINNPVLARVSN